MTAEDMQAQDPLENGAEDAEALEEEAPTEEHEHTASETQASELSTVEILADELDELRARADERDEIFDKLQRSKADFINYQKRAQRERERWREMTLQDFVLRLLPVIDDFERALEHAQESSDVETLAHGFELIKAKLLKALEDEDVHPFDAVGKPFDPAFHEAVAQIEKSEAFDQEVIEVLRTGYLIGDRVVRAAQVVVAKGGRPRPDDEIAVETDDADDDTEDAAPRSDD